MPENEDWLHDCPVCYVNMGKWWCPACNAFGYNNPRHQCLQCYHDLMDPGELLGIVQRFVEMMDADGHYRSYDQQLLDALRKRGFIGDQPKQKEGESES